MSAKSNDKLVAEADALDAKFNVALNARDVDAIMSLYWRSPELVSETPGS